MKTLIIRKSNLEYAAVTAAVNNCRLEVEEVAHPVDGIELVKITIFNNQPADHRILGYADKSGRVYTFTKEWDWKESEYATLDYSRCDICNTKHQRNSIFIISSQNKIQQVGGSCAANLNLENKISKLLREETITYKKLYNDEEKLGYCGNCFDLKNTLATIAATIYLNGFKPTSDEHSTLSAVSNYLFGDYKDTVLENRIKEQLDIDWANNCWKYLESQQWSSFNQSCKNAIVSNNVKLLGCLCALVWQIIKAERIVADKLIATNNRKECKEGETINLDAVIVATKLGQAFQYGSSVPVQITISDAVYGKLWFQTTSKKIVKAYLNQGDKISGTLLIKEIRDNIIFGKNVKVDNIIKHDI